MSARAGSLIAGAFLLVGALARRGRPLRWLVMSCRRYSAPAEKTAVQAVRKWKAQHPAAPP